MRMAICDDDEQEIEYFSGLITKYKLSRGESFVCDMFCNAFDLLGDIKCGKYDLVLFAYAMSGMSGPEAARELRELDQGVKIVFISSSAEADAGNYGVGAYYELLKPVDPDSFFALLDRVGGELSLQEEQGLMLRSRKGIARVFFTALEYVEVINKTVSFHLADGAIREVTAALGDYEGRLLSRQEFVKTHRSYLVNMNYVQGINGNCAVTKNGHCIPVSRQRRNQVQDAWLRFLHQDGASGPEAQIPAASAGTGDAGAPWRILLVDDDAAERTYWADILRRHGCVARLAENGGDALRLASEEAVDCVLLDVMIPGEDGFSICERLHNLIPAPVIFLSSLTEPDRQVEGFAAGGIDYITKDTPEELFWAKVETRIRLAVSGPGQLCYAPLLLDLRGHRVFLDGKELALASAEFDILWRLSEHAGKIFTPEEIYGLVWGGQPWDGGQAVQMNMSRLRRKLERAWDGHCFIEAVWGQGYRFVPARGC